MPCSFDTSMESFIILQHAVRAIPFYCKIFKKQIFVKKFQAGKDLRWCLREGKGQTFTETTHFKVMICMQLLIIVIIARFYQNIYRFNFSLSLYRMYVDNSILY